VRSLFTRFFQLAASGLLLIAAAVLALIINNSPLSYLYNGLLDVPVAVQVGALRSPSHCCCGSTTA
jgi:NhaA family Na+:H+ antiporter